MMSPSEAAREFPGSYQAVEKLPLYPLAPLIGYQIRRFWGFQSPICGRYQLNADFFNTLLPSRQLGE
jgi:hypothetical protein